MQKVRRSLRPKSESIGQCASKTSQCAPVRQCARLPRNNPADRWTGKPVRDRRGPATVTEQRPAARRCGSHWPHWGWEGVAGKARKPGDLPPIPTPSSTLVERGLRMSHQNLARVCAPARGHNTTLSIALAMLVLALFVANARAASDETIGDTFPVSVTQQGVYANDEGTADYGPVSISERRTLHRFREQLHQPRRTGTYRHDRGIRQGPAYRRSQTREPRERRHRRTGRRTRR